MSAADVGGIVSAAGGASPLGWLQAASPLISGVLGATKAPPSNASSSAYQNSSSDFGGFQVSTGSGSNSSAKSSDYVTYALLVGGFILAYRYFNK